MPDYLTEHLYVSTYCQHTEHHRCRLSCKLCESPCLCPCHHKPSTLEQIEQRVEDLSHGREASDA